jgi:Lrp/AsnC family transcriptional regulator, leucine-responsive regulatory protein
MSANPIHHPAGNASNLDERDRLIVQALQADDRLTYAEIGLRVGLSPAAVHERVKKLEQRQVIVGYGARVNPQMLGLHVVAFVSITLSSSHNCRDIAPALAEINSIEECYSVAGEVDVLIKVRTSTTEALEDLIYQIKQIEGVERTSTKVALSTRFEHRVLVVNS